MFDKTNLQHTDCYNFQCNVRQWRHLLSTVTVMFAVLLAGIQQGVELPESVCSIMTCGDISLCYSMWQPVSTYHQYALPMSTQCNTENRTAIWNTINPSSCSTARFCFPSPTLRQLLFTATAVCLVSLHVCQNTKTIISKIKFLFSTATSYRTPQIPTQNAQLPTYSSTF